MILLAGYATIVDVVKINLIGFNFGNNWLLLVFIIIFTLQIMFIKIKNCHKNSDTILLIKTFLNSIELT